jgi:hypothetical protein
MPKGTKKAARPKLTPFQRAENEFLALAGVDDDHSRRKTIADMVFIAQFELDLADEGESELSGRAIAKIRRFVKKWEGYPEEAAPLPTVVAGNASGSAVGGQVAEISEWEMPEYCICGNELTKENTIHCKNTDGDEFKRCDECRRLCDYRYDEERGAYCND